MIKTELLTIEQVSKLFKCHIRTATRLIAERVVPGGLKVGGRWMVREDVLTAWLDEQSRPEIENDSVDSVKR